MQTNRTEHFRRYQIERRGNKKPTFGIIQLLKFIFCGPANEQATRLQANITVMDDFKLGFQAIGRVLQRVVLLEEKVRNVLKSLG